MFPRKTYEFRVCAINNAGAGPFSQVSDPIIAQQAPFAPRVQLSMLTRDVIAYAGESAKVYSTING